MPKPPANLSFSHVGFYVHDLPKMEGVLHPACSASWRPTAASRAARLWFS